MVAIIIISQDAKEAILMDSIEMAAENLRLRSDWIESRVQYIKENSTSCYTLVFGHSPFILSLLAKGFSCIGGFDPLGTFEKEEAGLKDFGSTPFDFSENTLDALYRTTDTVYESALINRSLEIMTPEQGRAAMIGLHKRLRTRGRVLVVLERHLCVKQHLELLDEGYFEQMISPYFMIESMEEMPFETVFYKAYLLRSL